jgi:2-(1,2-epoxy-1,2-dihydrophenyl)acetyl-CoA isomerase
MTSGAARLEVVDGLAVLSLERAQSGNLLDERMLMALLDGAGRLQSERTARAVLIRSAGPNFCFGGDVRQFDDAGAELPVVIASLASLFHELLSRLWGLGVPMVAAVQGSAAGGGLSLACACDLIVAAESARFTFAYPRIGLSPDGGVSLTLTRKVGLSIALDWALTNRSVPAQEARAAGLVSRVVADEALEGEARDLAVGLAQGPTLALAASKRLILDSWLRTPAQQMREEAEVMSGLGRSRDAHEGVASFLAKRAPRFSGA